MATTALRWASPARHQRLRAAVGLELDAWRRAWACVPGRADCVTATLDVLPKGATSWRASRDGIEILAWGEPGLIPALAAELAELPRRRGASDAFGEEIGRMALQDLLERLSGGGVQLAESGSVEPASRDPRRTGVAFSMKFGTVALHLLLDHRACDRLLPVSAPVPALVSRHSALAPSTVTLQAHVALGDIALQVIGGLRPGDVLRTQVPLDATLQLRVADGAAVADAQLAVIDGYKAVRLTQTLN